MKELLAKYREYLDYIERHYDNVQKAWAEINLKCSGKEFRFMSDAFVWNTIDSDVKDHDLSKLSPNEFTQYRQFFFPASFETKDKELFNSAWEHHLVNNDHHWQLWTKYSDHPYADVFLVHNVIDWMAMGYEFGDTAKDYYEKNKDNIHLPKWAIELMYEIFDCVYK